MSYLNGLVVSPTLFNLSLHFAIRSSRTEPHSAPGLVFPDCIELLTSLAAKNIINLISVLNIWWCPCVASSFGLFESGVCYDQCVLLAKLLVFALLHFILQSQTCLVFRVISWLPTFAFQSPTMIRTPFLGVSSRQSYRSSQNHSTSAFMALVVEA